MGAFTRAVRGRIAVLFFVVLATACGARATAPPTDGGAPDEPDAGDDHDAGCVAPDPDGDGFSACDGDCDETDPTIHPGAEDTGGGWIVETAVAGVEGIEPTERIHLARGPHDDLHVAWVEWAGPAGRTLHHSTDAGGEWVDETVFDLGPADALGGIAVGPDGSVKMLYRRDGALVHARRTADGWTDEVAHEPAPTLTPPLAVGPSGESHVFLSVWDGRAATLRHLTNEIGEWTTEVVDATTDAGLITAVVVDDDGYVHAAYLVSQVPWMGAEVRWATNRTDGAEPWIVETIEPRQERFGYRMDLDVEPDGRPHVTWVREGVWHAIRTEDGWATSAIDERRAGIRTPAALEVEPDGTAVVCFQVSETNVGPWTPLCAEGGPDGWLVEPAPADARAALDLRLGSDGARHLAYWNGLAREIRHAELRAPADGVDQDCDGVDGVDRDGDGWASRQTGGEDCDDTRDDVHPGAPEVVGDGIDQDCEGWVL